MTLILTIDEFKSDWCVYTQKSSDGNLIWVGVAQLSKVYGFADAWLSPLWRGLMDGGGMAVSVDIIYTCQFEYMAHNWRASYMREPGNSPICNPLQVKAIKRGIRCKETGIVYVNNKEAAAANGITQGALSNHLNRRAGYESVRGLTFEHCVVQEG